MKFSIYILLFVVILLFLCTTSIRANGIAYKQYEKELILLVDDFLLTVRHSKNYEKRKEEARKNIPLVIKYCKQYKLDPLLHGLVLREEAGWKPHAKGKKGEHGIGQVMPGKFYEGIDLTTIEGQIEGSAKRLRYAFDQCGGDLYKALTHYGCGHCISSSERTKRKMKYRKEEYEKLVKKYRG